MSTFDSEAKSSVSKDPVLSIPVNAPAAICYSINEPSVIYQTFDQEVVAVHLNTGSYHTLSGIAGEVFLLMGSAGATVPEIAAELAVKYDASVDVIEKDVEKFIDDLQAQAMVKAVDASSTQRSSSAITPDLPRAAYMLRCWNPLVILRGWF